MRLLTYTTELSSKIIATAVAMVYLLGFSTNLIADSTTAKTENVVHTVEIQQFKFVPATIDIKLGDSIKWINRDIVPHTATADDNSWDTGEIKTDESKTITFEKGSISNYYCIFHPTMKADFKIIVVD